MATLKELDDRFRLRGPLRERFRAARMQLANTTLNGSPNQVESNWASAVRSDYESMLDKDFRIFVDTALVRDATDVISESGTGAITDAQITSECASLLSKFVEV